LAASFAVLLGEPFRNRIDYIRRKRRIDRIEGDFEHARVRLDPDFQSGRDHGECLLSGRGAPSLGTGRAHPKREAKGAGMLLINLVSMSNLLMALSRTGLLCRTMDVFGRRIRMFRESRGRVYTPGIEEVFIYTLYLDNARARYTGACARLKRNAAKPPKEHKTESIQRRRARMRL